MSFTIRGQSKYTSVCGGLVTILVMLAVFTQSSLTLYQELQNPQYTTFPTIFDYDYNKTIELDLRKNMVAYSLN